MCAVLPAMLPAIVAIKRPIGVQYRWYVCSYVANHVLLVGIRVAIVLHVLMLIMGCNVAYLCASEVL